MTETMTEPLNAGLHTCIPADRYHADPCPSPSLSSTIARILSERAPVHAWMEHPRLGNQPATRSAPSGQILIGAAVHETCLTDEDTVRQIDADSYRTKAAREERDEAIAAGKLPLLAGEYGEYTRRVERLRQHDVIRRLDRKDAELTAVWEHGGAYCRARFDVADFGRDVIYDLKCTARQATPEAWGRSNLWQMYSMQIGHYRAAYGALTGVLPDFRFIVQESEPPYEIRMFGMDSQGLEWCDRKAETARDDWAMLMAAYGADERWPGYPSDLCVMETPGWIAAQMDATYDGTHIENLGEGQ